jgi:hypothetical protein
MRPQATDYFDESEYWADVFDYEQGYVGDARRCPRHPHVVTSSADGMHDGLCGECEAALEAWREANDIDCPF